jgi:mycothiol synthase
MTHSQDTTSPLNISPQHHRLGLGLLLAGRADPNDPAVDHFLNYARDNRIDTSRIFGLWRQNKLIASVMFVPGPGKVVTVYASPPGRDAEPQALSSLVRSSALAQNPDHTRLIQAILDPWQLTEEQVFHQAGFNRLATLSYQQMSPVANRPDLTALLPQELHIRTWSQANIPLFERAILGSYVKTLDCPGLVGVRDISDVLEGHRAAGTFTPGWWFVIMDNPNPVGVMLLSPLSDKTTLEVVYLGLIPEFRGRKIGEKLLLGAEGIAFRFGYRNLSLAADENNPGAINLYKRLGFRPYTRKVAMILVLEKTVKNV